MDEETEFTKLPTEEKCVHKLWKARVAGYEEAAKLFQSQTDEKSPEFGKYLGLIKKFVLDSNAAAQEKGLVATLAFVENASVAGKTGGEVMGGLITKGFSSSRTKTKELAIEIALMYVEIERHELVMDELIKGMENKNPKIVVVCVYVYREALKQFGTSVVNIKPMLKQISKLLEDRDKNVREETKLLAVEIYRWIKDVIRTALQTLKPVQLSELDAEFAKVASEKAVPTRFLRSQQAKQAKIQEEEGDDEDDGEDNGDGNIPEAADPYDLIDPVDILAKLPKDFYEQCEAKKWQERKAAMETALELASNPKLENGDYGDLVRILKKAVAKDSNILVVALAAKVLANLANGLRKKFHPYANSVIQTVLEKFKEKKQNVVMALREAIDASYAATTLEAILEDVQGALDNKNPQIKAETAAFLTRVFARMTPTVLTKKLLKPLCTSLLKTLNDTDPIVRDNSSEAIGTAMKVVSEKIILPFLPDVDALKMAKVKENCEKAVIIAPQPQSKSAKPKSAKGSKKVVKEEALDEQPPEEVKPTPRARIVSAPAAKKSNIAAPGRQRPMSAVKPAPRNQSAGPKKGAARAQAAESPKEAEFLERELSDEEVQMQAEELFTPDVINGLTNTNWKDRLAAIEKFNEVVQAMDKSAIPAQVLVKLLAKKPGLKDNNFQVLKLRLEILTYIAENGQISRHTVTACISDLVDKIGDLKNGQASMAAITAFAEATNLDYISQEVLQLAFAQRNPKNQAEAINWMAIAIKEFGFGGLNVKSLVDYTKKCFAATNPAVRGSAINLLCAMYMYMGRTLRTLFEDEKPALLQQIDAELAKVQDVKPPLPVRGPAAKAATARAAGASNENLLEDDTNGPSAADLIPRTDISGQITESLITELEDKNWKIRAEALQKIANILSDAKFISPNIGDLTNALKSRLTDSNKNIAVQALTICHQLGTSLGPHCVKHIRATAPQLLASIGDSKNNVRAAGLTALNCWLENTNLCSFFECEMISDALKTENPFLRIELLGWLAETMPNAKGLPNVELALCIPHIYTCLEDRNAEVRKKAQDVLLPFMINLGYETMARGASKLKPASKSTVMAQLEKVRPNLPAKAPPKGKQQPASAAASNNEEPQRNKIPRSSSKGKIASKIASPPSAKNAKKDDDGDGGAALLANNLKDGRHSDEKSLKVLKWNFTTPREEFYILLKDQMTAANWGKALIANCFHNDFKFHIKAIDTFVECLNTDVDATIANVDLILKWFALRFFDTNPSVVLKGLEYLQQLFPILNSNGYKLHDYEASSFIPYIVLKLGDPKDTVRKGVRDILTQTFHVYPASKVFNYLMQGLASKNSRQRAECLEVLGSMFEIFGISVCQPSPTVSLKEVAKQISDRDNGVRTAALNCIVQVYYQEGEKVYKYIGQLQDKENSLLEERIKRSAKTRPPPAMASVAPLSRLDNHNTSGGSPGGFRGSPASHQQVQQQQTPQTPAHDNQPELQMRTITRPRSVRPRSTGPLQLQVDDIEQMYGREQATEKRVPEPVDVNADEILNLPDIQLPRTRMRPAASAVTLLNSSSGANMALNLVMAQLASQDIPVVVEAFVQVSEVLRQEDKAEMALSSRVDQILLMGAMQYRLAHNKHMADENVCKADVVKLFRCVTLTLTTLFDHPKLARLASRDVIRDLIPHLLTVILDTRLNELAEGPMVVKSINILVIRILQKSNPTHTMSALIKLLHECVGNVTATERYTELIMKCLWKMLRLINLYINELNIDRILLDCHVFLKSYPSSFWKEKSSDVPLRTIKTTLYHLVNVKGEDVNKHLTLIPNLQESDLHIYLNRMINVDKEKGEGGHRHRSNRGGHRSTNLESPEGLDMKRNKASPLRHLPRNSHDALAEIFKKIGDKEHTKEGLLELFEFQQGHPEADIEPFLQRSSEFFQNYIRRGLSNIAQEKNTGGSDTKRHSGGATNTEYKFSKEITFSKITHGSTEVEGSAAGLKIPSIDATPLDCLEYLKAFAAQLQLDGTKYTDPSYIQQFMAEIKSSGKEEVDYKKNLESDVKQYEELKKMFEKDMGMVGITH